MSTAKVGDRVAIDYTVKTQDGRIVGGTAQSGPQELTIGEAEIFPQVESALDGMETGESRNVLIASADAFGPRREELVVQIERGQLPANEEPTEGMSLAATTQDGNTVNLIITEVGDESVTADANHPLAGEDLHFDVKLLEIREAA